MFWLPFGSGLFDCGPDRWLLASEGLRSGELKVSMAG